MFRYEWESSSYRLSTTAVVDGLLRLLLTVAKTAKNAIVGWPRRMYWVLNRKPLTWNCQLSRVYSVDAFHHRLVVMKNNGTTHGLSYALVSARIRIHVLL